MVVVRGKFQAKITVEWAVRTHSRIPRVGVVLKTTSPEAAELGKRLLRELESLELEAVIDRESARVLGGTDEVERKDLPRRVDLIVVLGGDGTLLSVTHGEVAGTPILGINMGTLGFLTEHPAENLLPMLHATLAGKAKTVRRERLKVNPLPIWQLAVEEKWDRIRLLSVPGDSRYLGWTIEDIAKDQNTTGWDAIFNLMLDAGDAYAGVFLTGQAFLEEDNRLALANPLCAVASDTMALANDGILKGRQLGFLGYNWAARYIAYYLRDEKVLSLEEGIRRLTCLPASRVGLTDRGLLVPGAAADITIFNLEKVKDNSSFKDPTIYAGGFEHVIVNGVPALSQGTRTPDHAGIVLRRQ